MICVQTFFKVCGTQAHSSEKSPYMTWLNSLLQGPYILVFVIVLWAVRFSSFTHQISAERYDASGTALATQWRAKQEG